jgi:hypothetical protein
VYRAHALLPEIGFTPTPGPYHGLSPAHHHLTAIKRVAEGFSVSVEVHHALDLNERGQPVPYAAYAPDAQSFTVGGVAAQTLGREAMLWHVYRHTFCMPIGIEPLRLIWIADLISLVEAWVEVLDWERVRRQYQAAWNVLPLLHKFSPWSDTVLERLQLPVQRLPGARAGGWPRLALVRHRLKQLPWLMHDLFFPSQSWLRLHYREEPSRAGDGRAWLRHQRWLWKKIAQVLAQRVSARLRFK